MSLGARAFRAPSVAGIQWNEVMRRVTRALPGPEIIEDVYPHRDRLTETECCAAFGGSRDIQTDVYVSKILKLCVPTSTCDIRTKASPSATRREDIDRRRSELIRATKGCAEPAPDTKRRRVVSFYDTVVEYDVAGTVSARHLPHN